MTSLLSRANICAAIGFVILLAGCQHADKHLKSPTDCTEIEKGMNLSHSIKMLNLLSDAFSQKCYATVIEYATKAQSEFRHKTFSTLKETASIFLPDGTLTDYVLESYERGFLSVLLAASYLNLQKVEDAKVELRRLDHELFTPLYNYGEDPVNILLSAVLWEHLGEMGEARVDWHRLRDPARSLKNLDGPIRSFADLRVSRIDEGRPLETGWRIYGIGQFPAIEWDLQFTGSDNGYFLVKPKEQFLPACSSPTGLRISTQSWFEKVAMRHNNAYHPLLNMQSWIRLPIGIMYSLVPVAAGAGLAVGGCMADASISGGRGGVLCELSIRGGIVLMSKAPQVLKGALEPDLRHWERIPAAFVVTRAAQLKEEQCAPNVPSSQVITILRNNVTGANPPS
ncbi:MAG: hypothetical protein HY581_09310 [Nitrospirae bacterium]|nr:hypothetical protein [Nitrospirota bacterium]